MSLRVTGDIYASGNITGATMTVPAAAVTNDSVAAAAAIARTKLAQDTKSFPVEFALFRVHDALQTTLPGTSASDDLGVYGGTFGSTGPLIRTYDVKTLTTTLYARALVRLPAEYDGGEALTLRIKAGMVTTVAGTSCTVDVEAYKVDKAGAVGSDICATAAQSINSLTFANKDFTITPTALTAGDVLDVRLAISVVDGATATAVIGAIGGVDLLAAIRG